MQTIQKYTMRTLTPQILLQQNNYITNTFEDETGKPTNKFARNNEVQQDNNNKKIVHHNPT